MHEIRLNEQLYHEAQRRASEAGFGSVDDFVAEVLKQQWDGKAEDLDHLFTPERLAQIDRAEAQINSGKSFTAEQADAELAKRRVQWLHEHPR